MMNALESSMAVRTPVTSATLMLASTAYLGRSFGELNPFGSLALASATQRIPSATRE